MGLDSRVPSAQLGSHSTALSVPVQFLVALNRAGKFKIELKATDQLSGKTVELKFPISVQQSK